MRFNENKTFYDRRLSTTSRDSLFVCAKSEGLVCCRMSSEALCAEASATSISSIRDLAAVSSSALVARLFEAEVNLLLTAPTFPRDSATFAMNELT